ncbi:MAG: orotidine-5'-phosphate decarboxylase [Chloroflexi bacterium]|nr:orotidine-5'-phosphate decarboxylase [Chloroflexota bacterium]
MSAFVEKLAKASSENRSFVCVGLDPDPALMAIPDVLAFNKAIVDATKDLVCAYKPNLPFYEALGLEGLKALEGTISHIRKVAPDVIVLGDGKRGDIASTNVMYARALFEVWGFDAATVNAYGGGESLEPFFAHEDKGVFVWCRSSNPGAKEFQDMRLASDGFDRLTTRAGSMTLYEWMAQLASGWNARGNVGLVVGATYPEELARVRSLAPGMPILIPGVGAQGGDLERSVRAGLDSGRHNILVASSRGITYASKIGSTGSLEHRADFAEAARRAASELRERVNAVLKGEGRGWSSS